MIYCFWKRKWNSSMPTGFSINGNMLCKKKNVHEGRLKKKGTSPLYLISQC